MQRTPEQILASLAPPGAGLPRHHLLFIRGFIRPFVERRASWDDCAAAFLAQDTALRAQCTGLSPAELEVRVLVPKLIGLEDSSRYWSVAMTCRHLETVGGLIVDVIERLGRGETIRERVDFAAVKPVPVPAAEALAGYQRFADAVPARLASARLRTGTVPHPWFGDLDARGWHWLLGFHSWVHVRQARAIRSELQAFRA